MTWRQRIRMAWHVLRGRIGVHEHSTQVVLPDEFDVSDRISVAYLQHKGSRVCMDVTCPRCGHDDHIDADFAYFLFCEACGAAIEVGSHLPLRVVGEAAADGPWTLLWQSHRDELTIEGESA